MSDSVWEALMTLLLTFLVVVVFIVLCLTLGDIVPW